MLSASQWLDWYKTQSCLYSDYQLAKKWAVPTSYISQYRSGRMRLPLANVLMMAQVLNVEALEIITALAYHRAPQRHKETIRKVYFDALLKTVCDRMNAQSRGEFVHRRKC